MSKPKTKYNTTDGVQETVRAVAAGVPMPASHVRLPDDALPYYVEIVRSKDPSYWTPLDLSTAATVAINQARLDKANAQLDSEGLTIKTTTTTKANPLIAICSDLNRLILAGKQHLQIHPLATVGNSDDQIARNQAFAKVAHLPPVTGGVQLEPFSYED